MRLLIIFLFFSLLLINNVYAGSYKIKNTKIYDITDNNIIFKTNKNIDKIEKSIYGCFYKDKNKKFKKYKNVVFQYIEGKGFGIKIKDNFNKNLKGFCILKFDDKDKIIKINFIYKKVKYKSNLDISNKIFKYSIQKRALSCEISASSDLISTIKNIDISEDQLLKEIKKSKFFNKKAILKEDGKRIWGNPEEGFVGYIDKYNGRDALQYKYEGYGVYEQPISKLYEGYGIKTKIINKKDYNIFFGEKEHLELLLVELNKGNLVQLWGDYCVTPGLDDGKIELRLNQKLSNLDIKKGVNAKNICYKDGEFNRELIWYYKENGEYKEFTGLNGEHAFYLLGYKGGIKNPTHIIVWDTFTGKHSYPVNEWLRKWRLVDNRSLIVYKINN